jgi:hypothetical protein
MGKLCAVKTELRISKAPVAYVLHLKKTDPTSLPAQRIARLINPNGPRLLLTVGAAVDQEGVRFQRPNRRFGR